MRAKRKDKKIMNDKNTTFIKFVEEKSKDNPLIKIQFVAKEVAFMLQKYCM